MGMGMGRKNRKLSSSQRKKFRAIQDELNSTMSKEGRWVTIAGRRIFIRKGKKKRKKTSGTISEGRKLQDTIRKMTIASGLRPYDD